MKKENIIPEAIIPNDGRVLPHDIDTEMNLLGNFMYVPRTFNDCNGIVTAECFFIPDHQKIFECISELMFETGTSDIIQTNRRLKEKGYQIDYSYVSMLTNYVASSANMEYHALILKQLYIQRQLIGIGYQIANYAYELNCKIFELMNHFSSELARITEIKSSVAVSASEGIAKIEESFDEVKKEGIKTYFPQVDSLLGDFKGSEVIIIAARSSMGKTAWALKIARNCVESTNKSVLFFSLETSTKKLICRLLAPIVRIPANAIADNNISNWQRKCITEAKEAWIDKKFHIIDAPELNISILKTKAQNHKLKHGLSAIFIDYLQLMKGSQDKSANREQQIASISRGLKLIAKELDVPIIALAQLNRDVNGSASKRPTMSMIRESDAISMDADKIMLLYRPEYYGIDTTMVNGQEVPTGGLCEIIVDKNKDGSTGTAVLTFNPLYMDFTEWEPQSYVERRTVEKSNKDDETPF